MKAALLIIGGGALLVSLLLLGCIWAAWLLDDRLEDQL